MFNLFDLLQAQAGPGAQGFGQQFGLSQDQSRRAMEALMPAFTMGLQRNAANDPMGFSQLFNMFGPNAAGLNTASSTPQMEMLVRQLFGSPHLSQAVLQQAAATSGVAAPILKQMLPMMAGLVVAGIVHVMVNQNPAPAPAPASPFGFPGQAWAEMMQNFLRAAGQPQAKPNPSPAMRGSGTSRNASGRPSLDLQPSTKTIESKPSDKKAGDVPLDLFQQMFQSGLAAQQENVQAMQRLFDTFWQDQAASPDAARASLDPKPKAGRSTR